MSDLHGEVISWEMPAKEVAYGDVRDALDRANLDPDLAKELSTRNAFLRACKHLKQERTIDKLEGNGDILSFQFTRRALEGGRFEYDYECRVEVDIKTGDVHCEENPQLGKEAQKLLIYASETRTSQDVTRLVQKLFKDHADLFALNSKGCAYFVPIQHQHFTDQVEKFFTALGGEIKRFPVPVGTENGNRSVRESVSRGLSELIDELNATVEEWDETTRESTIERAHERWEQARYKIEAYATYLEASQEDLLKKLDESKAKMLSKTTLCDSL